MAAAGRGRDAEASALLANGADVRLASLDGSTAAGWAARYAALHLHNLHLRFAMCHLYAPACRGYALEDGTVDPGRLPFPVRAQKQVWSRAALCSIGGS